MSSCSICRKVCTRKPSSSSARADQAALHQEVGEAARAAALVLADHRREVLGAHQALAEQHLAEAVLDRLVEGVGADHRAAQEGDGDDVVFALQGEDAVLAEGRDPLQDPGQGRVAEIAFDDSHAAQPRAQRRQRKNIRRRSGTSPADHAQGAARIEGDRRAVADPAEEDQGEAGPPPAGSPGRRRCRCRRWPSRGPG